MIKNQERLGQYINNIMKKKIETRDAPRAIGTYSQAITSGNMTFMEQRKRYRKAYEDLTSAELQQRFDAMTDEQRTRLMQEIENENN